MNKDIYIIKNSVNKKVYIGQSKNPAKRWLSHIYNTKYEAKVGKFDQAIHRAMSEIGIEKFHYEILESQISNPDEREQYWIRYYKSTIPNGYNVTKGGQGFGSGIDSVKAIFKDKDTLMECISEISSSRKTFSNIAKKYGCSEEVIVAINQGKRYRVPGIEYPIRQTRYRSELLRQVRYSIKYETDLSFKKIAEKYSIDCSQISLINQGKIYYVSSDSYPLRKKRKRDIDDTVVSDIINDILYSEMSLGDIAKKYNVSAARISRINQGKNYVKSALKYPLRRVDDPRNADKKKYIDIYDIKKIHTMLKNGDSIKTIANKYGISDTMIRNINNGKCKKYILQGEKYPIRPLKHKTQQPVSTICV